jgi:hypothetical protein
MKTSTTQTPDHWAVTLADEQLAREHATRDEQARAETAALERAALIRSSGLVFLDRTMAELGIVAAMVNARAGRLLLSTSRTMAGVALHAPDGYVIFTFADVETALDARPDLVVLTQFPSESSLRRTEMGYSFDVADGRLVIFGLAPEAFTRHVLSHFLTTLPLNGR